MNKKTIFLVDDDQVFRQMLWDVFEDDDRLSLYEFSSGEACLEKLFLRPDIIILDHNFDMLGKGAANGLQIFEQVRAKLPECKVIVLSGQEDGKTVFQYSMDGATDYIIKDDEVFDNIKNSVEELLK